MSKFTVDWCENATAKTGKVYKKVVLKDEKGETHNVNLFNDYPDFANLKPGVSIDGEIEMNGRYKNLKSNAIKERKYTKPDFTKAMERKEESIKGFQDNKENSIKMAGSARDATLIVTTFYPELANESNKEEKIRAKWLEWKEYFLLGF